MNDESTVHRMCGRSMAGLDLSVDGQRSDFISTVTLKELSFFFFFQIHDRAVQRKFNVRDSSSHTSIGEQGCKVKPYSLFFSTYQSGEEPRSSFGILHLKLDFFFTFLSALTHSLQGPITRST